MSGANLKMSVGFILLLVAIATAFSQEDAGFNSSKTMQSLLGHTGYLDGSTTGISVEDYIKGPTYNSIESTTLDVIQNENSLKTDPPYGLSLDSNEDLSGDTTGDSGSSGQSDSGDDSSGDFTDDGGSSGQSDSGDDLSGDSTGDSGSSDQSDSGDGSSGDSTGDGGSSDQSDSGDGSSGDSTGDGGSSEEGSTGDASSGDTKTDNTGSSSASSESTSTDQNKKSTPDTNSENIAPDRPDPLSGPSEGYVGVAYAYSTSSIDPNDDVLTLTFEWGDGDSTDVKSNSGALVKATHKWYEEGTYTVIAIATDAKGEISEPSEPFEVIIYQNERSAGEEDISDGDIPGNDSTNPETDSANGSDNPDKTDSSDSNVTTTNDGSQDGNVTYVNIDTIDTNTTDINTTDSDVVVINETNTETNDVGSNSNNDTDVGDSAVEDGNNTENSEDVSVVTIEKISPGAKNYTIVDDNITDAELDEEIPTIPERPDGPTDGYIGEEYTFSTVSTDPLNRKITYTFDWSDEDETVVSNVVSGTTASADHEWTEEGEYEVSVKALAYRGTTSTDWSEPAVISIIYPMPDVPEVPSGIDSGYTDVEYEFTTVSTDPLGRKIKYGFDWGDGTEPTTTGSITSGRTASAEHSWEDDGTYYITVWAIDPEGEETDWSDYKEVTISIPIPDTPTQPSGPTEGYIDESYDYTTTSVDPLGRGIKYKFDWGDGEETTIGPSSSGRTVKGTHTWTEADDYDVSVMAISTDDEESDYSEVTTVTIMEPSPTVPTLSGPESGIPGQTYSYVVSSTSPINQNIMYTIDWGDGQTEETSYKSSGNSVTLYHEWTVAGLYAVTVMATDKTDLESDWSDPLMVSINRPPNTPGSISGPSVGNMGDLCSFSVSATDPDGQYVTLLFDWGDGTQLESDPVPSGTSATVDHSWDLRGTYSIQAQAIDSMGATSSWSSSVSIVINGCPETPNIPEGPSSGNPGETYTFQSFATDPDGDTLYIIFDWGDGTQEEVGPISSGGVAAADHVWTGSGIYEVRAKARDINDAESGFSEPLVVTINNPPNVPDVPIGPGLGSPETIYSYTVSATDPNGDDLVIIIDWGDDSQSESDLVASGSIVTLDHAWANSGTYGVTAQARDEKGAVSGWSSSLQVIINNPPNIPATPIGPTQGDPDSSYTFTTSALDPELDRVWITFDWGDGLTTQSDLVASAVPVSASHIWVESGTFKVRAMATDEHSATSDYSDEATIVINQPPGKPTLTGPTAGDVLETLTYSVSSIDPEGNRVKFLINWGDLTTDETDFVSSGESTTIDHEWLISGTFTVTVMATDEKGSTSEWSDDLQVEITVPATNHAPDTPAVPTGLTSGYTGLGYSYSSSATDPDGNSVKLTFDWDDDTTSETGFVSSGADAESYHYWTNPGDYDVSVMATDIMGSKSGWSEALTVHIEKPPNNPPAVPEMVAGPTDGYVETEYTYTTSATDYDGDKVKIQIDWGDATQFESDFVTSGETVTATHSWATGGIYDVKAMSTDEWGDTSAWTDDLKVNINAPPERPSRPSGESDVNIGSEYTYTTSSHDINDDTLEIEMEWGDETISRIGSVKSDDIVEFPHTWTQPGSHQVRAMATDEKGESSIWSEVLDVSVNAPPGQPEKPIGPATGLVNVQYSYSTSSVDPNEDLVTITVDWGDGTNSESEQVASGTIVGLNHIWVIGGNYVVKAMAVDTKGSASDWSEELTVEINTPPNRPTVPDGATQGTIDEEYTYTTSSTDDDGDDVSITIDWGDGTTMQSESVTSGDTVSFKHIWGNGGPYVVKAMSTDSKGATSDWSDEHSVDINTPPNKPTTPEGPAIGQVTEQYTYTVTSDDEDDDLVKTTVYWGDETSSESELVPSGTTVEFIHSWAVGGTYEIRARATDVHEAVSELSDPLSVTINHKPNTPSAPVGPTDGDVGTDYTFTAIGIDPDGDDVKMTIDWGDDSSDTSELLPSGSTFTMTHKWTTGGSFDVKAMATDVYGASSDWSDPLVVYENSPPETPTIPAGETLLEPNAAFFYSSSSVDPEGDLVTITFDWGDSKKSTTGQVNSGSSARTTHFWTKRGLYEVRAQATDEHGKLSEWSDPLEVRVNTPPGNPSKPATKSKYGVVGETYSFTTTARDSDRDDICYMIDWGNGESISVTDFVKSGKKVTVEHSWDNSGTYSVRAKAEDLYGFSSDWSDTLEFKIDTPPNVPDTPSGETDALTNQDYEYVTTASDPDGDQITVTIDWGDRSKAFSAVIESGEEVVATHKWRKAGTYEVKAKAMDENKVVSDWSDPLIVNSNTAPYVPKLPSGPRLGATGESYSYTSSSKDKDKDLVSLTFDWDDGTTTVTEFLTSGTKVEATHIWTTGGIYGVRVMATDSRGTSSDWSLETEVTIGTPPNKPSVPEGPTLGEAKVNYEYSVTATDVDGGQLHYEFDWGDKKSSETGAVNSGEAGTAAHSWRSTGTYDVTAKAIDSNGFESESSDSLQVVINGPPRKPSTPSGSSSGLAGDTLTYRFVANDNEDDDLKYTIDWGDGTITETGFYPSRQKVEVDHVWDTVGTYEITVMATDVYGASSEWSKAKKVKIK